MIIEIRNLLRDLKPDSRIELPNPYDLAANPEAFLDKGFAVVLKPRSNTEGLNSPARSIETTMSIVLTNGVRDADTQVSSRLAAEESLYADATSLTNDILKLQGITGKKFVGDDGIEYLNPEKNRILKLELEFNFTYKEVLT